jgi:hypothetical protein
MRTCDRCGSEINFRYIDGEVRPLCRCSGKSDYDRDQGFRSKQYKPFTHDSYINPNAYCPVCRESVVFYQSPYGGRVYFDKVGWPWPKHPCTDRSARTTTSKLSPQHLPPEFDYQNTDPDWRAFKCTEVEENNGGFTRLFGHIQGMDQTLALTIISTNQWLGVHPMQIKVIDMSSGKYKIGTFSLNEKTSKVCLLEFDAYSTPHKGVILTSQQRAASNALFNAGMNSEGQRMQIILNCPNLNELIISARRLEAGTRIINDLYNLGELTSDEGRSWFDNIIDKLSDVGSEAHAQKMAIRHLLKAKGYEVAFMPEEGIKPVLEYLDTTLRKRERFNIKVFAEHSKARIKPCR